MRTGTLMAVSILGLAIQGPSPAVAEIVERELGTDAEGKPVSGYVFQGGREFRGSARRTSGLAPRRVTRPSRYRDRVDHGGSYGFDSSGWVIPVIPLHGCGGFSLWRHTNVVGVTITVIR